MEPLTAIADNPALFTALKEVLERHFKTDSAPYSTTANAQLGEIYRAKLMALDSLKDAFKEILSHRTPTIIPMQPRRGR